MKKGFTLIELMIVVAIIAIIAAIAIPGLLAAQRASNERNASASLKTFNTAQADFRANDRDNNRMLDFWTGDVFGLYGVYPASSDGTLIANGPSATTCAKLIEPSIASADGDFGVVLTYGTDYTGVDIADSIVNFSPKAGYFYRAFRESETAPGTATTIQDDTDGATFFGDVHDFGRYAFMACPVSRGNGTFIFIVNEDATIYRIPVGGSYTAVYTGGTATSGSVVTTGDGTVDAAIETNRTWLQAPAAAPASGGYGASKLD